MPAPAGVPKPAWEAAETSEMREVILLYGKTYHFWQADRGDPLPLGAPQLMASFTSEDKVKLVQPKGLDGLLAGRDEAFGVDYKVKAEKRKDIEPPNLSPGKHFGACLRSCIIADNCHRCRHHGVE